MSPIVQLLLLAPSLATSYVGFFPARHDFFFSEWPTDYYSLNTYSGCGRETSQSPSWAATNDAYSLKMRLPAMEPDSVTAQLAADQSTIKVTGKRKVEGCACEPTAVREIALPYRPRSEDVSVAIDDNVLTLKLARHAQADAPVSLSVQVAQAKQELPQAKEALTTGQAKEGSTADARPIRFIPHPSASPASDEAPSVSAQETRLVDKFRAATRAAQAFAPDQAASAAPHEEAAKEPPAAEAGAAA